MLAPRIIEAAPAGPSVLQAVFADGAVRLFDVRRYTSSPYFAALNDPSYFARVRVVDGTVTWPDGQDFDRGTIYALGGASRPRARPTGPKVPDPRSWR